MKINIPFVDQRFTDKVELIFINLFNTIGRTRPILGAAAIQAYVVLINVVAERCS